MIDAGTDVCIYLLRQLSRGPHLTIYTPSFKTGLALLSTLANSIWQKVMLPAVMFSTETLLSPRSFRVCTLRSQLPCKKLTILRLPYHEEAQAARLYACRRNEALVNSVQVSSQPALTPSHVDLPAILPPGDPMHRSRNVWSTRKIMRYPNCPYFKPQVLGQIPMQQQGMIYINYYRDYRIK